MGSNSSAVVARASPKVCRTGFTAILISIDFNSAFASVSRCFSSFSFRQRLPFAPKYFRPSPDSFAPIAGAFCAYAVTRFAVLGGPFHFEKANTWSK